MDRVPQVGDVVHFYLNDDLAVSPATVLNTAVSCDPALLARQRPAVPVGAYLWESGRLGRVDVDGVPIVPPSDGTHVDLKVDGLVHTYRAYNVPFSNSPTAGHWTWPPTA